MADASKGLERAEYRIYSKTDCNAMDAETFILDAMNTCEQQFHGGGTRQPLTVNWPAIPTK